MKKGKLIFFCGKMGAGKSTEASKVAQEGNSVLLVEDEWLASLYPNKISSLEDYIKYSNQLKPQIKKLAQSILVTGANVVMDFPANTISQRSWFRTIFLEVDTSHNLIFIDASDETCLAQIEKRCQSHPERALTDTPEMFEQITKYFVEPSPDELFDITRIVKGENKP
ncbi:AAA family ATPase [Agarilytica rhodophyticola]|uniref:AAA family ATPase n=1 Tax=Agarilytica rhodophyticola TaxID=1737490 RepID=UPI000B345E08|nr:ATP-binding protein [Agarilytica rhodophyticola]